MKVHIWGHRGRLGSQLLARLPTQHRCPSPHAADCWVLAVPSRAAPALLAQAAHRTVVDLSGALKHSGTGRYALMHRDNLHDGHPPQHGDHLANPGCFAGAVIRGLQHAQLVPHLNGPIQVTAVGGKSTAHRDQDGGIRLANRLQDHPHAGEIQQAFPGVQISHFALTVAYTQPQGILSITTGTLHPHAPLCTSGRSTLDVNDALGQPDVLWKLHIHEDRFTLACAVDNIVFPVDNALRVIASLCRSTGKG